MLIAGWVIIFLWRMQAMQMQKMNHIKIRFTLPELFKWYEYYSLYNLCIAPALINICCRRC